MSNKTVSVVQMNSGADVDANLDCAARLIRQAAETGAGLVVLPEAFAFIGAELQQQLEVSEPDGIGKIQDFLAEQSRLHGVWIVGGTVPIRGEHKSRVFAACFLYDAQGRRVTTYRKIHLFDVYVEASNTSYQETGVFIPGREVVVVSTPFGRLGFAVCYDLRFPELFRLMVDRGVEMIALPAAFTAETGRAHWSALLKTRAVENMVYLLAAAQTGIHADARETYGHSMIVDPWGQVSAGLEREVATVSAPVDAAMQTRVRQNFPCLSHRVFYVKGEKS